MNPFRSNSSEPLIFHLDNINGFIEPGIESAAAGKAAGGYIEAAVELCAAGSVDAIATAPINKRSLFLGGYTFPRPHRISGTSNRQRRICHGFRRREPAHSFDLNARTAGRGHQAG